MAALLDVEILGPGHHKHLFVNMSPLCRFVQAGAVSTAYIRIVLEVVEDAGPLCMGSCSVDEGSMQLEGVLPQGEDVVGEDDDLVPPDPLMVLHEELARLELVGVHAVQQLLAPCILGLQVFPVELLTACK